MSHIRRREVLAGTALVLLRQAAAKAGVIAGELPWAPNTESLPTAARPGPWFFFTTAEGAAIEALADRIIPPDPETLGGKDAGCAVFLDRQLAGPYGHNEGHYNAGPFEKGVEQQGPQNPDTPAVTYRKALAALDEYCLHAHGGRSWVELSAQDQDELLHGLESGTVVLPGLDARKFFENLVRDIQQGFFADPIYGGNRDMCAWKMIGFPGAHYDYREWVGRHNERWPHPPVGIAGRPAWNPDRS
ncbi:MAG TPA: gluconate 2-dehydrogenase subunit 3 family protein [Steroidobacteraceae bacterium]|nr:gluconate 2-dehydrogenase subunit 3 family protein [Steroidobacteraceae bacterium]